MLTFIETITSNAFAHIGYQILKRVFQSGDVAPEDNVDYVVTRVWRTHTQGRKF